MPNANALKGMGSHVLAVAVGDGVRGDETLERLVSVSGPDVIESGSGATFDGDTDVYRATSFEDLEPALRALAFALCAPVVNVQKFVDFTPDPGTDDAIAASGWGMSATVTPTPESWAKPPDASGSTANTTTGGDGVASFDWRPGPGLSSVITVTEQDPATVAPGFINDTAQTSCVVRTPASPNDAPLELTNVGPGTFTASVPHQGIVTCEMVNVVPPAPAVTIEKYTNGVDADTPAEALSIPIDTLVTWTYHVTNAGNVTLGITVSDDQEVAVTCPVTSLAPGEDTLCTAEGTAAEGPYANVGTVTATHPFTGSPLVVSDPSHYVGVTSGIDIEKATNGVDDDDDPTGPYIPVGADVTWSYVITNTGETTITGISAVDDPEGALTCELDTLDAGASMTCDAITSTAAAGQYQNTATVVGTSPGGPVSDTDASHYFGEQPGITIQKFTGTDPADDPTGPLYSVGDTVTWVYVVTNTGNVPLTWEVTDNQGVDVTCPDLGLLRAGEEGVFHCFAQAPAEAGQHSNIGTVTATSPSGTVLDDDDPAHYFGVLGDIDIEKHTNGVDADTPPGPYVLAGSTVEWTYIVTNTGNSALSGVVVTDSRIGQICVIGDLALAGTVTCSATGPAQEGQYTNSGLVIGATPTGVTVSDEDLSNYRGGTPGIDLEKHTNGTDADDPEGALVPVGGDVEWTYIVRNSGTTMLTNLVVTDDQDGVEVDCPETSIPPGEVVICTATGVAEEGQYANLGTASASSSVGSVSESDPSHYFGFVSEIHVEKFVNGNDADTAPGIELAVGDPITWTYEVTNPGNILIRSVTLVDDQGLVPIFVDGDDADLALEPGETWTYEATSAAAPGSHVNIATVSGLDMLEGPVMHTDPANYFTGEVAPGETATIGDTVWNDLNADGDQDAGEPGIAGARVDVTDAATGETRTFTTDADGKYGVGVIPGEYTVTLDMTSVESTLTTPGSYTMTLASGEERLDADFGVVEDEEDPGDAELPDTALPPPVAARQLVIPALLGGAHRPD